GPAVLGMADCRVLGRVVDATILVVRSGSQEMRPLQRAKAMLEQSKVPLAGVVFNALADDLDNWACYGSTAMAASAPFGPVRPAPELARDDVPEGAMATD